MKVDFIISELYAGGAQRVMVLLAEHFAKNCHYVRLVTFVDGEQYKLSNNIDRVRLHHGRIKLHKVRSLINLYNYYKKKDNRPELIISFLPHTNLISIIVARIFRLKIIVSEHNNHGRIYPPKWLTNITRNFIYRNADYLTVLTEYDVNYYKKRGAKVIVMPNPCTFEIFQDNPEREAKIVAAGSLNRFHHKGFDTLIKLLPAVLKKHPTWKVQILGGGDKGKKHLIKLTKELGIESNIEFVGFTNDVAKYMQKGSIFILPSRYEGLPMVLLEAMSQGMACIAFDCKTGPSDIITHEWNGLLIEDQDIDKMQKGLSRLISSNELRYRLAENAKNSLSRYTIESVYQKWLELLE